MNETETTAPDDYAARIEALEAAAAHQQRVIDELSDALTERWRAETALERRLSRLSDRLDEIEPQTGDAPAIEKPPHW